MTKYYYRPIKDKVLEIYRENASRELDAPENFDEVSVLVVEAENEEVSEKIRIAFTDIRMWEKIREE